jgi:quercetin dioxygenase-like cupin family protein
MKSTSELINQLKKEGYKNIFLYSNTKGTYYNWHRHPYEEVRIMLKGKMKINTKNNSFLLSPGDRLDVPAGEEHEAYVLEDCEYICGTKY